MRPNPGFAAAALLGLLALGLLGAGALLRAEGAREVASCDAQAPSINLCALRSLGEDLAAAQLGSAALAAAMLGVVALGLGEAHRRGRLG